MKGLVISGLTLVLCSIELPPSTVDVKLKNKAEIQVSVAGEAKGVVFRIDNEAIRRAVLEEVEAMFTGEGESVQVAVDIHIKYEWKWVRFIPLWLLVPLGAPSGKHIGEAKVIVIIEDMEPAQYNGSSSVEAFQGLWYGWKYDPPFGGGVISFAIRDAIDQVKRKIRTLFL